MTFNFSKLLIIILTAVFTISCKEEIEPIPPQANFTFETGAGGAVTFANTSTGSDLSYTWSFGDDKGTSSEVNPTYSYEFNGSYPVKLVVTNSLGKDSLESNITVSSGKDLIVKASVSLASLSGGITEFRNSSQNADTFFWDFGDGNTSTEASPKHNYIYNDRYLVKLVATNSKSKVSDTRNFTIDYTDGKSTRIYALNNNSTVFVLGNKEGGLGGYAYALDATNGNIKWRHYLNGSAVAAPTFTNNGVFLVNDRSDLRALNITNGGELWEYEGPWSSLSTPLMTKDVVYSTFWDSDNTFLGLNYTNSARSVQFTTRIPDKLTYSSPTDGSSNRIFFCDGRYDSFLNCYQGNKLQWRKLIEGFTSVNGGVLYNVGRVYVGARKGFYCFNEETGEVLWENNKITLTGDCSPTHDDGLVYASSLTKLYAFDAKTGEITWTFDLPVGSGFSIPQIHSSPIVSGDIVYVGSINNKLYAVNKKTGQLVWDFTTNGVIYASPVVAENQVYITNTKGKVYALNATTGLRIWDTEIISSGENFSPSVLTKSGQYYHSSVNGLQN